MPAIHVSPPVIPIALRLWFKRSECTSTCKSTGRRPEWSSLTLTPTRTRESPLACDKGHDLRAPCRLSVSRGQSALPYLLLLSMPHHTSSLSSSHALSSTLRRKTLSRMLSVSPISTQKGLSTRALPDTRLLNPSRSRPGHTISPHKPGSASVEGARKSAEAGVWVCECVGGFGTGLPSVSPLTATLTRLHLLVTLTRLHLLATLTRLHLTEPLKRLRVTGKGKRLRVTSKGKRLRVTGKGKRLRVAGKGKRLRVTGEG
jgi:hypothetical protein